MARVEDKWSVSNKCISLPNEMWEFIDWQAGNTNQSRSATLRHIVKLAMKEYETPISRTE